eukprot:TRINITY_DN3492_c0_g3_i2.p1 TRINITY_DN3492_c0_g3~~TRINITY_DN3492_c0_g3_i2.p1  ORF type:complete len:155 (+),score=61.51 TRINITY_DN3492_c0_g3_i2:80-544(+)
MGQNQAPAKGGQPAPDINDVIFNMKMTSKTFARESTKSEKESKKELEKAKLALKKGNEEGARLFLANAAQKQKESLNYLKMSHKMDALSTQIKSNMNNQMMADQLAKMTPILNYQADSVPIEKIYSQLSQFQDCLLYTSPSPRDGLLSRMPSSA